MGIVIPFPKLQNAITIYDVANYFLAKENMNHKKLQKLCYYAYVWHYTFYEERLFEERFQAWIHGPVAPSLYKKYSHFSWKEIEATEFVSPAILENENVLGLLKEVYENYEELTGEELEFLSQEEEPWLEARKGLASHEACHNWLQDEVIYHFYDLQFQENQKENTL